MSTNQIKCCQIVNVVFELFLIGSREEKEKDAGNKSQRNVQVILTEILTCVKGRLTKRFSTA